MAKNGNTADDEFVISDKGKITLKIDEKSIVLRRPTIGQMRTLDEYADEISTTEEAEIAAAKGADPPRKPRSMAPELLGWWRLAVDLMGPDDVELPDDDDCPLWMVNTETIKEAKFAWRTVPWGPGGAPSTKAAEESAKKAAALLPMVSTVADLARAVK